MKNIKEKVNKIFKKTIFNELFVMEMVFFIGLAIIIFTNFSVNIKFGLYFLGLILIAFSIFLYRFTGKRGDNK